MRTFGHLKIYSIFSTVVGAGSARLPAKVLICRKFEHNLKKIGQRSLDIFNHSNEVALLYIEYIINESILCHEKKH